MPLRPISASSSIVVAPSCPCTLFLPPFPTRLVRTISHDVTTSRHHDISCARVKAQPHFAELNLSFYLLASADGFGLNNTCYPLSVLGTTVNSI
ncbi:hypothetical protein P280DRAFT_190507 [Massarina eburnea CBS 473.64]|uniref:Uncharacterized protein n=1 Tax=Massarina eburnea CBS 473.64 TaxID=1395130 RepID=A0A6A6SE74_9PLEO|nr:hypothetical protein P280DRAFT_190507 [Massarina eburnea CBS 473.64]